MQLNTWARGEPGGRPFTWAGRALPSRHPVRGLSRLFSLLAHFLILKYFFPKAATQPPSRAARSAGRGRARRPHGTEPALTAGPEPPLTALPARRSGATCRPGPAGTRMSRHKSTPRATDGVAAVAHQRR